MADTLKRGKQAADAERLLNGVFWNPPNETQVTSF